MTDVLDSATGEVVDHPDAEIARDWEAGRVQPLAGQTYHFRFQNGEYGHASTAQEIATAVAQGGQFVPADQARAAVEAQALEAKSGGAIGAAAAAGLSGLTLGLSDVAGKAAFGQQFARARAYQRSAHGTASALGEGLGAAGLTALTGVGGLAEGAAGRLVGEGAAEGLSSIAGESAGGGLASLAEDAAAQAPRAAIAGEGAQAAAAAAAAAGEGTGLAADLGAAAPEAPGGDLASEILSEAPKAVARKSRSVAAQVSARALVSGARAAVEGAQLGLSQSISQAAIEDPHLSAEQVVANVGANALWGGVLGAGFGALGGGLARAGRTHLEPEAADYGEVASKVLGTGHESGVVSPAAQEVKDGVGAAIAKGGAKLAAAVSGHDPELIAEVMANRGQLVGADEARVAASRAIRDNVDGLLKANREMGEIWQRGIKRDYVRSALEGVDADKAAAHAYDTVDSAYQAIREMAEDTRQYGQTGAIRDALTTTEDTAKKMQEAWAKRDVAEMYSLVDDLKKGIGKYTKGAERVAKGPGSATNELQYLQNEARYAKYKATYEDLRTSLENEDVWGEMGKKQKDINAMYTQQLTSAKRFNDSLTTMYGRDELDPWREARVADPAKVHAYVNNLIDPNQDLTHNAVTAYVGGSRRLAETMADAFDLEPRQMAALSTIRKASDAFHATLSTQAKRLQVLNQYRQLTQQSDGRAMMLSSMAAAAGGAVGGMPGALALGNLANTLTHPAETIRKLAVLEHMASDSDSFIGRTVRAFGRGAARAAPPADKTLSQYPRVAASVAQAASDPQALRARLGASVAPLRPHMPQVADALIGVGLSGMQFLASKLPPQTPPDPLNPKAKQPPPPPSQREAFLRYHAAVTDPHSVVTQLRDGKLAPEGVEALKTVYPRLYARVQSQIFDALAQGQLKDMSANQRYGLALMTDIPVPELSPEYIDARQRAATAALGAFDPAPPGAGGASGPPKSGAGLGNPSRKSKALPAPKPQLVAEQVETGT